MRDYLFRGQAISDKQWVYGSLIIKEGHYYIVPQEPDWYIHDVWIDDDGRIDGWAVPVIPETVGQYTNMNDVDGQMIFEGDILEGNNEVMYSGDAYNINGDRRLYFWAKTYRVVGNIYDKE